MLPKILVLFSRHKYQKRNNSNIRELISNASILTKIYFYIFKDYQNIESSSLLVGSQIFLLAPNCRVIPNKLFKENGHFSTCLFATFTYKDITLSDAEKNERYLLEKMPNILTSTVMDSSIPYNIFYETRILVSPNKIEQARKLYAFYKTRGHPLFTITV